jgi:hypothetical protein
MDKEAWQQISFDKGHLLKNVHNILLLMGKDRYGEGYDKIFDNLQVKQELDWKFRTSKYGLLYERHMKSLLSLGSVLKDPFTLAETIASEFIGDNNSTSVSYLSSGPLLLGDRRDHDFGRNRGFNRDQDYGRDHDYDNYRNRPRELPPLTRGYDRHIQKEEMGPSLPLPQALRLPPQ